MELSLEEYIRNTPDSNSQERKYFARQIIHGLKDLHRQNFAIGDLSIKKIIVHKRGNETFSEITQFGFFNTIRQLRGYSIKPKVLSEDLHCYGNILCQLINWNVKESLSVLSGRDRPQWINLVKMCMKKIPQINHIYSLVHWLE
jgi:serine/threonine protein kinase